MAPGCKPGARKRYAGSNPALPNGRALHSGNALAFQARVAGSIPAARSTENALCGKSFSILPWGLF
jgi:hypothetical protein